MSGLAVALSLTAAAGIESSRLDESTFLSTTRDRILTLLYVGREEAALYQGCLGIEAGHPDTRWLSDRQIDATQISGTCQAMLRELRSLITSRSHEMRIALALSAPASREDRILDDISSRIRTRITHPFLGAADLSPLSPSEQAEALSIYQSLVDQGRREFETRRGPQYIATRLSNRIIRDGDEESFILRKIDAERKNYLRRYFELLSELPILAFLPTPQPTVAELDRALQEIHDNGSKVIRKIELADLRDDSVYAGFLPVIDQVVKEEPGYAGIAKAWRAKVEHHAKMKKIATNVLEAGLWVGGIVFDEAPILGPIIEGIDSIALIYKTVTAVLDYHEQYTEIASSVRGMIGHESIERMSDGSRELLVAHAVIANWIRR